MITITTIIIMLFALLASMFWTNTVYTEEMKEKAMNGDMEAQYELALCYQTGSGVKEDMEYAGFWFAQAAGQGHAEAIFIMNALIRDV